MLIYIVYSIGSLVEIRIFCVYYFTYVGPLELKRFGLLVFYIPPLRGDIVSLDYDFI